MYLSLIYIYIYIHTYIHVMGWLLRPDPRTRTVRSRECLGNHRKGTPGIGNADYVFDVGY